MRTILFLSIGLSLILTSCSGASTAVEARTLTVYAAASLSDVFREIGAAFESMHPGVNLVFNFGGSQNLRTQIEQGAPADVFASANEREMETLGAQDLVAANAPRVFLTNRLVLIMPEDNPAGIQSLQGLAKPGLKLILAAEDVPAGRYAREILDRLNEEFGESYSDRVLANVVSNEDNVRQAVTKVQLGEADASLVYVSDTIAAPALKMIEIPTDVNVVAEYQIAALVESAHPDLANQFIAYVLSPDGQAALKRWGFTPVVP